MGPRVPPGPRPGGQKSATTGVRCERSSTWLAKSRSPTSMLKASGGMGGNSAGELLALELLLELSGRVQLGHDVAAAEELAVHVELRDGGPGGVFLDALAHVGRAQDVDRRVLRQQAVQDLHHASGETALRRRPVALHEEHHAVRCDQRGERGTSRFGQAHEISFWERWGTIARAPERFPWPKSTSSDARCTTCASRSPTAVTSAAPTACPPRSTGRSTSSSPGR